MKPANFALVAVLVVILAIAAFGAYVEWTSMSTAMPAAGWAALIGGVVISILLGAGLMALMFYSNRHGWDEEVRDSSVFRDEHPGEPPPPHDGRY
jgi:hypothetical protein